MMVASMTDNDELQLNAYGDCELDLASAAAFERRMADDELLQTQYTRLISLRQAFRSLPQSDVPAGLRARIRSTLDAERPARVTSQVEGEVRVLRPRSRSFQALAAAAVFGAAISSSVMMTLDYFDQREEVASQVVAGHIRGLLAPQPFDVASSDRHTVKPWFTARLPESPQVPDLAAQGFTLLGGRVDVIGHDPVATIVYKHAAHTVSLSTLGSGQSVSDQVVAGYNVRSWSDADFTYVAVSDLPAADLASFERVFSAGPSTPEVK
jgi:anti-sigma factor RsiW